MDNESKTQHDDRTLRQAYAEVCEKNEALQNRVAELKDCVLEMKKILDAISLSDTTRYLVNYLVEHELKSHHLWPIS